MVKDHQHTPDLVTIGITCYNAEDTISRAIKSALEQEWPNKEIIIVDDCSTDNSIAVIESIIKDQQLINLVRLEQNRGPAAARNAILNHANGEYIVFFDDDDESFPDRVREQIKTLHDYEKQSGVELIACYASGKRYYPNGYTITMPAIGSSKTVPCGTELVDYLLFFRRQAGSYYGSGIPTCALLARKKTFEAAGKFDENMRRVEDADFAIRLAFLGGHFIGTQKILYSQYATAASDKSYESNLQSELYLVEKNRSYLCSVGRYHYARHWPRLRYWHFKRRYLKFVGEFLLIFIRNPIVVTKHLFRSGPRRLLHERNMYRSGN